MPRAPPTSAPVSEMADGRPRALGSEPNRRSARWSARTGEPGPTKLLRETPTSNARPDDTRTASRKARAKAAAARQAPARKPGGSGGEPRGEVRADDEGGGRRQRPETGLQGRQPAHQLQVLRDEQEIAEGHEHPEQVGDEDALKDRMRKRRRSISGTARASCRRMKQRPDPRPNRREATGEIPKPFCAACLSPKMMASRATSDKRHSTGPGGPLPGCETPAKRAGPSASSRPITGSASRNTEPHQKYSMSRPPGSARWRCRPKTRDIHTPMAAARCRGRGTC